MSKKETSQTDRLSLCDAAAQACIRLEASRREAFETAATGLRKLGVTAIGRRGKDPLADRFYDTLIAGGCAEGTAANYLAAFRLAVEGKGATLNPSRAKAAKGAELSALVAKLMNHAGYPAWIRGVQDRYDNAEGSIDAIFEAYLKREGFTLKG